MDLLFVGRLETTVDILYVRDRKLHLLHSLQVFERSPRSPVGTISFGLCHLSRRGDLLLATSRGLARFETKPYFDALTIHLGSKSLKNN